LRVDSIHQNVLVQKWDGEVVATKMINCRPVLLDSPIEMDWRNVPTASIHSATPTDQTAPTSVHPASVTASPSVSPSGLSSRLRFLPDYENVAPKGFKYELAGGDNKMEKELQILAVIYMMKYKRKK
jgi:hypothetical protein